MNLLFEKFENINTYTPNVVAYIGDSVYEVAIRSAVISAGNRPMKKIHNDVKSYVSGKGQIKIYEIIKPYLNEEEKDFFRKGRNAKVGSYSKSLELAEYKVATGFECIIGYLYLMGKIDRINYLIKKGISDEWV